MNMGTKRKKPTRRKFLELTTAGTAFASFEGCVHAATMSPVSGAKHNKANSRKNYTLFSEGQIANVKLKNRLVRSATAEGASPEGRISEKGLHLYRRLAEGGTGLIITGHVVAVAAGDAHPFQTHIDGDTYIDSLAKIVETVHTADDKCKVIPEITHAGRSGIVDPVAPSETSSRGNKPRVLSTAEVEDVVKQFADSIRRVKDAGFDGVQLHGAHGYLLSSFLSPATNKRTDRYGGSREARTTIIKEIIASGRELVGPDFPILIKMNCDDLGEKRGDTQSFVEVAGYLVAAGLDAIEISGVNPSRMAIDNPDKEAYFLDYAQALDSDVPVILTGGNRSLEKAEGIVRNGKTDFIGLARPLIREPDLPAKWLADKGPGTAACISCNQCFGTITMGPPTHCVFEQT